MGATLRNIGLTLLVATAWLILAEELGWLTGELPQMLVRPVGGAAILCLGIGWVLRLIQPVARELDRGRCARCGARTERGQTYCLDHLQQTVREYQDEAHRRGHDRGARG
jgi:hypothetical protein